MRILTNIFIGCVGFLSLLTQSCKSHTEIEEVTEVNLEFKTIEGGYEFGVPIGMNVLNGTLLVNDFYGDYLVHCIDMSTWATTRKIVRKGVGPGEVLAPIELIVTGDSIAVFSRPTMMMFRFEGTDLKNLKSEAIMPSVVSRILQMSEDEYVASVIPYGNTQGFDSEKRFLVLGKSGKITDCFGEYPRLWAEEKDIPSEVLANYHQIRGFCKLSDDSFAAVSSHVLSVYAKNKDGKYELVKETKMMPYEYDYSLSDGTSSAQGKLRDGFHMCADGVVSYNGDLIVAFNMNKLPDLSQNVEFLRYDQDLNLTTIYHPTSAVRAPFIIDENGAIIALDDVKGDFNIVISTPLG